MDALSFAYDFFLSRRGSVAAVAREVADVLEAEGYRVRVQDYDFAAGGQFVAAIDDALKQARDLLILYSRITAASGLGRSFTTSSPQSLPRMARAASRTAQACWHRRSAACRWRWTMPGPT